MQSILRRFDRKLQTAPTHLPHPQGRVDAMLEDITNQDEKQECTLAFDGFGMLAHDDTFRS